MGEPFMSEIRIVSFNYAPRGWAFANGQLLPINQNQPLFSLLGTTFGGDGRVNFGLPDLRARVPLHVGPSHTLGERGGEQAHTVSQSEMPQHTHLAQATASDAATNLPITPPSSTGNLLAGAANVYGPADALTSITPATVGTLGGSQAHLNMQPFLTLTFCISLLGIFPSPN
jgi:microcystin-dependent protein